MLSLRVVHNFVNKFLKRSARLFVSGGSLRALPKAGKPSGRAELPRPRCAGPRLPAEARLSPVPVRCEGVFRGTCSRLGMLLPRNGSGPDGFRSGRRGGANVIPTPSKFNLPRQTRNSLNRAVIFP